MGKADAVIRSRERHHAGPSAGGVFHAAVSFGRVPTCSRRRSIATTGTRRVRPILMVGKSPRAAAAYEASRRSPKYRAPASGTVSVLRGLVLGLVRAVV